MKTKEQLARELENEKTWKSIRPASFWNLFFSTKKNFNRYANADWKGVADVVVLRTDEYEDCHYATIAFSTKGALSEDAINTLKERVNEFPVNAVRYESTGNGGFYPMVSDEGEYYSEDYELHRQAEDMDGVYVAPFMVVKKENLNCPYIIYAHYEGQLYIYYVNAKFL